MRSSIASWPRSAAAGGGRAEPGSGRDRRRQPESGKSRPESVVGGVDLGHCLEAIRESSDLALASWRRAARSPGREKRLCTASIAARPSAVAHSVTVLTSSCRCFPATEPGTSIFARSKML